MTSRIFTNLGVEDVSDAEFFTRIFGHPPRTKTEKEAEWNAEVERYVELILSGAELSSYGNPQVIEAKRRIALREGDAGVIGNPLLRKDAA